MKPIGITELNEYIELIRANGYDVPVGISGTEQCGKSTLAMKCIIAKQGITVDQVDVFQKFLEKNVIFNPSEIWKIRNLPDNAEVPVDEAIRVAWRREFYRPENRWLIKLFRQFGRARRVYYLNIPKFWSLDEEILSDRVKVWIHIIKKDVKTVNGEPVPTKFHAVLFQKDYHAYQEDPWMKRDAKKILREENRKIGVVSLIPHNLGPVLRRYIRLPSFKAYLQFDPMPDPLWAVYNKFSMEKKLGYEKRDSDDVDKWKFRFYAMVYNLHNRGVPRREIAELLEIEGIPLLNETWVSQNWQSIVDMIDDSKQKELRSVVHQRKTMNRTGPSPPGGLRVPSDSGLTITRTRPHKHQTVDRQTAKH